MIVTTAPSLDPSFRLYRKGDEYVRVKISVNNADTGTYTLTAQVASKDGCALGPESSPLNLTHAMDEIDLPPFIATEVGAVKGDHYRVEGRIYEYNGTEMVDHGPISEGLPDSVAEMLVVWNKAGIRLAEKALRAWKRQSAQQEINTLLGV